MLPAFAKEGYDLVGTFNFDGRFSEALAAHGYVEVSDQGGDDELYRIENDVYVPPGEDEGEGAMSGRRQAQIEMNSPRDGGS
eukprot:911107-Rhodomonas_salina.1